MVHTFSSREEQFGALDQFDLSDVKKFAREASKRIIIGPTSCENFDSQISNADQVHKIIENLMFLYLECCKYDVSVEKLIQFLESKQLKSEYAAAIADEYHKSESKIRDPCSGANNLLHYLDMQWRLEAKVGSRSLPNQVVPLFSMDFKLGDSSTVVGTQQLSHEILQTDPVTLLCIADSLEKALSGTRSRNLRKIQKQIKKLALD